MTESTIHQPTQNVIDRLEMLRKGAAVLMLGFLGVGAILVLTQDGDRLALIVGLHLINMGVTMIIAVGAVANHIAILRQLAASDRRFTALCSAATDEVARHRNGLHN